MTQSFSPEGPVRLDLLAPDPERERIRNLPGNRWGYIPLGPGETPDTTPNVRLALTAAEGTKADDIYTAKRHARELGVAEGVAQYAPEAAKANVEAKRLQSTPELAQWASMSVNNAAMARDDMPAMQALHKAVNGEIKAEEPNIFERIPLLLQEGSAQVGQSLLGFLSGLARTMGTTTFTDSDGAQQEARSELLHNIADTLDVGIRNMEKRMPARLQAESFAGNLAQDVVRMAPQLLSQVGATMVGGPWAGMSMMGAQIAGGQYNALTSPEQEKPVDSDRAFVAGLTNAALQAPLEQLGLSKLAGIFKTSGAWNVFKRTVEGMLAEGGTEFLQSFPESATDIWARLQEDEGAREWLDRFVSDLPQTVKEGLYEAAVAAPFGLLGGIGKASYDAARQRRAQAWADRQMALHDRVEDLQAKQQGATDTVEELLRVQGMTEEVTLSAADIVQLYQSGTDIITPMGWNLEELETAAALGEDMTAPLAQLHANLDKPQFDAVAGILRENPDAVRVADAETLPDRIQADVEQVRALYQQGAQAEIAITEERNRLREEMRQAVADTPGLRAQAEALAGGVDSYVDAVLAPMEAFARRMAAVSGEDASSIFRRVTLDRLRASRTPEQNLTADIAADLDAVQSEFAPAEETAGTATATAEEAQAEAAPPRNAPVVHEGVASVDDLYRVASEAQPAFNEALNGLAAATGGEVLLRPGDGLKSRERAQQKVDSDYGPEGANRVVDVLGGTLLYDNRAAVEAALPVIEQEVQRLGGEVVRVKNRFERPSAGYRDYLLNIRMPNGFVTEVLLTTKAMSEAKNGHGHGLYEMGQIIKDALAQENISALERSTLELLRDYLDDISETFYASTGQESSETASLSGIVEPLNQASVLLEVLSSSSVYPKLADLLGNIRYALPPLASTNGISSYSTNFLTNTGSLGVPFSQGTPDRSLPSSERTMSGMVEPPVDTSNITPNGAESKSLPAQNAGRVRGADTVIAGSQGREAAHYELREMADVIPSHDPLNGFAKRADYPEGVQERPYHSDPAEQDKVREHALKLDPIYLVTDNPDATNGPSIITESGVVLGGNSRAMSIQQAYASNPERANIYREAIKAKAGNFGLDPAAVDAMQQPMLVRVVDGDMDAQQMAVKSRLYNETPTQALQTKAEGVSRARMLSERSLNLFAEGMAEYDTLREFTAKPASRAFVESLLADGVIEKTKASTLVDQRTGLLTDDGKALVENALRGLVVADYDTLNAAAPSVLQKLDRSVPALVQLKARGEGWDMSGVVTRALQVLNAVTANKQDMDTALGQGSLLQGGNPAQAARPAVQAMALTFEKATQKEIAARFAHMVEDSRALSETDAQGLLGDIAPQNTPATSFVASFLKPVVTVGGVPVRNFDPVGNPLHGAIAWAAAHGGKGRTVEGAQAELEKTLRSKKASKEEKLAAREMIGQLAQVTGAVAEYRPRLGGYFSYQQGQPLFQFLGEQGAGRLDAAEEATTRLDNLAVAREMEQAGKDAKAVKLATGWERGADGKWRYEVDDSGVKVSLLGDMVARRTDANYARYMELFDRFDTLTEQEKRELFELDDQYGYTGSRERWRQEVADGKEVRLAEMMDAPELFAAYPDLRKVKVSLAILPGSNNRISGRWDGEEIVLDRGIIYSGKAEENNLRAILLHEVQHAIQDIEGFARGSSPEVFEEKTKWQMSRLRAANLEREELLAEVRSADPDIKQAVDDFVQGRITNAEKDARIDAAVQLSEHGERIAELDEEIARNNAELETLLHSAADAKEAYNRTAGEVEARNTSARSGMTAAERLQSLASETEDVAREDQIILRDGLQGAAMMEGATNSYGVPLERVTVIDGDITPADVEAALKELAGRDLPNLIEGITAQVNRTQRDKLTSGAAQEKSAANNFSYGEHNSAAAQIENAWKWAAKAYNERHRSEHSDAIMGRYVSALNVNGKDAFAWITTKKGAAGERIYSVELMDEKKLRSTLSTGPAKAEPNVPVRSFDDIVKRLNRPVNPRGGNTLYQREQAAPLGSMQIYPENYLISLFEGANLSTLLHETGHVFFEEMERLAGMEGADAALVRDFATLREWVGAQPGQDLSIPQKEQLARGFEAWLREGKAPSRELEGAFARFRSWLMQIYKSAVQLQVQLTDEVRGVFGRMLSTEQELADAAARNELIDLTERELDALGLTGAEREYAGGLMQAAQEAASIRLQQARERGRKERRARFTQQATNELRDTQTYRTRSDMRKTPLDIDAVKANFGEEVARDIMKKMPATLKELGEDPEIFAAEHGYESAASMFTAMRNAPTLREAVAARVAEMEAEHDARQDALDYLFEAEETTSQIALVGQYLARNAKAEHVQQEAFRRAASEEMWKMPAGKALQSGNFAAAMRRALATERRAIGKGDFGAALEANYAARLNLELAKQSRELARNVEKLENNVKRFTAMQKGDADARYAVNDVAARYGLAKANPRLAEGRDGTTIRDWLETARQDGYEIFADDAVLYGAGKHRREATVAELDAVGETIRQIITVERNRRKLFTEQAKQDLDEAAAEIAATIRAHRASKPVKTVEEGSPLLDSLASYHAFHMKVEAICRALDGDKLGVAWNYIYKPVNEAEDRQALRIREARDTLRGMFAAYTQKELHAMGQRRELVPEVGETLSWENRLAVALNMGNAENIERIRAGHGWTDEQIAAVLRPLTARDWNFVQSVWDYLETFKEESFQLEEDVTGLRPRAVEAKPLVVQTADGQRLELKGGYYPIAYNRKKSLRQQAFGDKEADKELFGGRNYGAAMTKHGHLKARSQGGEGTPLNLHLSVVTDHVFNTIHDLCYRKAVLDVAKIIRHKAVQAAFTDTGARHLYRQLMPWLQSVANEHQAPMGGLDKMASWARAATSVMTMGLKATTIVAQPFGITQTMEILGYKYTGIGLKTVCGNPANWPQLWKETAARSSFMASRLQSFDREVRDITKDLMPGMGRFKWVQVLRDKAFVPMGLVQMGVDLPTWWGAYAKGLADNAGDERLAAQYADHVVRMSQGSGATKDLSRIQRGTNVERLFTMFYSYFNTFYNLGARRIAALRDHHSPADIFMAANAAMLLWFIPAVFTELAAGRGPDDDDDDWLKWSAMQLMQYPFQTMIGVREVASGIFGEFGYTITPAQSAPKSFVKWAKAVEKAIEEEDAAKLAKPTAEAVGYALRLPMKQMIITTEGMWNFLTDERGDAQVRDLFFTKPQGRR